MSTTNITVGDVVVPTDDTGRDSLWSTVATLIGKASKAFRSARSTFMVPLGEHLAALRLSYQDSDGKPDFGGRSASYREHFRKVTNPLLPAELVNVTSSKRSEAIDTRLAKQEITQTTADDWRASLEDYKYVTEQGSYYCRKALAEMDAAGTIKLPERGGDGDEKAKKTSVLAVTKQSSRRGSQPSETASSKALRSFVEKNAEDNGSSLLQEHFAISTARSLQTITNGMMTVLNSDMPAGADLLRVAEILRSVETTISYAMTLCGQAIHADEEKAAKRPAAKVTGRAKKSAAAEQDEQGAVNA